MIVDTPSYIENRALYELRSRCKRKRAESRFGKEFWAIPNFQPTTFKTPDTAERIDLLGDYAVLFKEHRPFIGNGEYIVTYQIIEL